MRFRIRLLPICIAVAFVMLSIKSYDLGKGVTLTPANVSVPQLQAQTVGNAVGVEPSANTPVQIAQAQPVAGNGDDQQAALPEGEAETAPPLRSEFLANQDEFSESELDVLTALQSRREELEAREGALIQRENMLLASEQRIEKKIAELESLQQSIAALLRQHNEEEEQQLANLVRIYEAMKPRDAAEIFEELDMLVLLDVVERMKERRVAPILAAMDPAKAKLVTAELANRRELPIPKE